MEREAIKQGERETFVRRGLNHKSVDKDTDQRKRRKNRRKEGAKEGRGRQDSQ